MLKGDDLVFFTMDDEERRGDLWDIFVIWEAVSREDRDSGGSAKSAQKGRDKKESSIRMLSGQPATGTGADGLADQDDVFCFGGEVLDEVMIGGFDGAVASFFRGVATAFTVAGIII